MNNVLWVYFLTFFLSSLSSQADVLATEDLEKVIQQLDWDMTWVGQQGRKVRNRAVTKLTCMGQQGEAQENRVLQTAGRLLGHENPLVTEAASQIFTNLNESSERYLQKFRLRSRPLQDWTDMENILEDLVLNKLEGLEIIHEFYPTMGETARLNQLVDLFFRRTGQVLKVCLRVFSLNKPTPMEWTAIYSITGEVIQDFHLDQVPTDFICPTEE